MIVQLGNHAPKEGYRTPVDPAASAAELEKLAGEWEVPVAADPGDPKSRKATKEVLAARLADHVRYRPLGDHRVTTIAFPSERSFVDALREVTDPRGVWAAHSDEPPAWVASDDPELEAALARHFGCERGAPKDVEAAYYTASGPPGVGPEGEVRKRGGGSGAATAASATSALAFLALFPLALAWLSRLVAALKTNAGNDLVSDAIGAHSATDTGTATGVTATTLTNTGKSWVVNAWAGRQVVMGGAYAVVLTNTATVLTVDRWYNPADPGGSAAATPAAGVYVIVPGNNPAAYIAITENSTAPAATDTTLAGELTAGGLGRSLATYAHTAGASTYTLTRVWTSSDGTTRTIAKAGVFGAQNGGRMLFTTLVSPTAVLATGDTLTVTETVTIT